VICLVLVYLVTIHIAEFVISISIAFILCTFVAHINRIIVIAIVYYKQCQTVQFLNFA